MNTVTVSPIDFYNASDRPCRKLRTHLNRYLQFYSRDKSQSFQLWKKNRGKNCGNDIHFLFFNKEKGENGVLFTRCVKPILASFLAL